MTTKQMVNRATKTIYDDMIFDSEYEKNIYIILKKLTTYRDNSITLSVKPGVIIKPAFSVFPARKWLCDFRLDHPIEGSINIEAKGFHTREFRIDMEMLEGFNPTEFQRTIIVPLPTSDIWKMYKNMNSQLWSISQMKERVLDPFYWRRLNGN